MKTVLEVNDVTMEFSRHKKGSFKALDHISFTLEENQCLGIVGESGSGKSTMAKIVCGLLDPTEGSVTVLGKEIGALRGKERRKIYSDLQMVFQMPQQSFNPRKTLGFGIGEALRNGGMNKFEIDKKVGELLVLCGLDESFADRYPGEVSGGQCQRAAIARALSSDPKILICDEATSALDVTVQKQILELLMDLKEKKGLSILFICHNLALVQMLCDRVVVLKGGKAVEQGTADEVIFTPKSEYTKLLLDAVL